jgi:hypothetical protein
MSGMEGQWRLRGVSGGIAWDVAVLAGENVDVGWRAKFYSIKGIQV